MKLFIPCYDCYLNQLPTFKLVEVRDDSTYSMTCSRGHHTVAVLQRQKFEVLFEIALHAILDGYYREAVSSFTSSLERFYEFAIRVLLESSSLSKGLGSSEILFKECWTKVAGNSERQLGAFIFIWAGCLIKEPKVLLKPQVEFRNKVIHKGIIPTKDEALKYGNAVIEVIRPNIQQLQESFSNEVEEVTSRDIRDRNNKAGEKAVSMPTLTPISLTRDQDSNIEEYLASLDTCRKAFDILNQ